MLGLNDLEGIFPPKGFCEWLEPKVLGAAPGLQAGLALPGGGTPVGPWQQLWALLCSGPCPCHFAKSWSWQEVPRSGCQAQLAAPGATAGL